MDDIWKFLKCALRPKLWTVSNLICDFDVASKQNSVITSFFKMKYPVNNSIVGLWKRLGSNKVQLICFMMVKLIMPFMRHECYMFIKCRFPKNPRRREQWVRAVRCASDTWIPNDYSVLCSLHFSSNDIVVNQGQKQLVKWHLTDRAVPLTLVDNPKLVINHNNFKQRFTIQH